MGLVAVVGIALAARLWVLFEIRDHVFFRALISDGAAYDAWAARIAAGEWLGTGVFYQAPLYPYFLAAVQRVVGEDLGRMRAVQAAVGAVACGLLALAGGRLFGRAAGLAAGVLLALYPPAIFADLLIQKTVLDSLFLAAMLWLVSGAAAQQAGGARSGLAAWTAAGAALGALGLTRENALLLLPVVAGWGWMRLRKMPRPGRALRLLALACGAALLLVPVGLRNLLVGGEFALSTSQLGPNFYIGNHAGAPGVYVPLRANRSDPLNERKDATELAEGALGRSLSPGEVSRYWLGRSWEFIRDEPAAWMRLMGIKLLLALNAYEVPDAEDFYFFQRTSAGLRVGGAVFHFGVLLPLAAAGAVLLGRPRDASLLYVIIAALVVSVALFYVFGRYRFTLVPPLALLAGGAVAAVAERVDRRPVRVRRSARRWLAAGGAAGLAAFAANARFAAVGERLAPFWFRSARPVFHRDAQLAVSLANAGHVLARQGRLDEAIAAYGQAAAAQPRFAGAHFQLGAALCRAGRLADAIAAFQTAQRLDPRSSLTTLSLAAALAQHGDRAGAERHLRAGLALTPIEAVGWNRAGATETALGEWARGIEHLRRAVREAPEDRGLRIDLAEALVVCPEVGRRAPEEAVALLEPIVHPPPLPRSGVRRGRDGRRLAPGEAEAWAAEPRAWLALAEGYFALGRVEDAAAAAEVALRAAEKAGRASQERAAEGLRRYRASATSQAATGSGP